MESKGETLTPVEPKKQNLVSAPNYGKEAKWQKLKRKVRSIVLKKIANTPLKFKIYRSYWNYKFSPKTQSSGDQVGKRHYLTQKPNFGAGIGHQLANWNTGLYFANYFKVNYAHSPFSTEKWESFLGFGEGEVQVSQLENDKKFKIVTLPRFDSENQDEVNLIGNIISSYKNHDALFQLELDQGYMRQYDTTPVLSEKFFKAAARKNNKLVFSDNTFNIAIHIRRRMKIETLEVWKERGLENEYYANVLKQVLSLIKTDKEIKVYFFSQGNIEEFPEFQQFDNITYCLDMGPIDSVLHMIYADLLISSKSSFSYKPALISKNIKICPQTFWHGYPDTADYILADNDGNFDTNRLLAIYDKMYAQPS
jgi:hypothetical protein